jgi:hypothetical protein
VLGFGDKTNYVPDHLPPSRHEGFQRVITTVYDAKLRWDYQSARVIGKLKRMAGVRAR